MCKVTRENSVVLSSLCASLDYHNDLLVWSPQSCHTMPGISKQKHLAVVIAGAAE